MTHNWLWTEREQVLLKWFDSHSTFPIFFKLKIKLLSHGTITLVPNSKCMEESGVIGSDLHSLKKYVNHFKTLSMLLDSCCVVLCLQTSYVDSLRNALSQSPHWVPRTWHRESQETSSFLDTFGPPWLFQILSFPSALAISEHQRKKHRRYCRSWMGKERCICSPGYYSTGFSPCKRNAV